MEESAFFPEQLNNFNRIAALPEKMTQIAIGADLLAYGGTQFQQRHGVVDDKTGMHLESEFVDPMITSELRRSLPVRHDLFVPLPVQHFSELGWPAIGHPVRQ